jgi:hypothetical protein
MDASLPPFLLTRQFSKMVYVVLAEPFKFNEGFAWACDYPSKDAELSVRPSPNVIGWDAWAVAALRTAALCRSPEEVAVLVLDFQLRDKVRFE